MKSPVISVEPLDFQWKTEDPFLFCVHHLDHYPRGNEQLGPAASLDGRALGQDFAGKDGWRMYHGEQVPGFPSHPHRGFETVTIVRRGFIDHSDSLGACARFGAGDVQWLTAGNGIQHSEMFPLLQREAENPLELFQIWLNLPRASKAAKPYFSMFWSEQMPVYRARDLQGRETAVTVIAGPLEGIRPLPPPPESWASNPRSELAIWSGHMAPGAHWTLPPALPDTRRTLYLFSGGQLGVAGEPAEGRLGIRLEPTAAVPLAAPEGGPVDWLLLQGRPLQEPVVQHGPFVGNSPEDIYRAFSDYRATQFGGWPWETQAPVHARGEGRFARHADGRVERPAA